MSGGFPRYWMLFVVAFPVVHYYFYAVVGMLVDPDDTELTYWSYSLLAFGGGGLVYFLAPMETPFGFEPWYLAVVPVGVALYFAETFVWANYTGKPIRTAVRPLKAMLPVPAVALPEEVVYRAGPLPLLSLFGAPVYVVVSGLLFGFHHYAFSKRDVVLKSVDGMLYATIFVATGSLWASTLIHVGYNVASVSIIADYRDWPVIGRYQPGT